MSDRREILVTGSIPGDPHPQGRGRIVRRGRFASIKDPDDSFNWKAEVKTMLAEKFQRPIEGPIHLSLECRFQMPKSRHRKKSPRPSEWHIGQKDCDNLAKSFMDAGQGIGWLNDGQISSLSVRKVYAAQGERSETIFLIRSLDPLTS